MKNKLLLLGVLGISFVALVWCQKSDWGWTVWQADDNEWFAVAEWYCEDEWWEIEMWEDGDGYRPVCFYEENESYCYLEDLYEGLCNKWGITNRTSVVVSVLLSKGKINDLLTFNPHQPRCPTLGGITQKD